MNSSFDYAVIHVVPRVERGEFVNAGIILFCRELRFLGARVALVDERLRVLAPWVDPEEVREHLAVIPLVTAGSPKAGPIGQLDLAGRFHWLVAPRSTVIQTSPVHSGLCSDPAAMLDHIFETLVDV
jgi:hypothetical protein